jgi:3-isopropylmalate/(R)-2-methylmalate dehydratase small subunit
MLLSGQWDATGQLVAQADAIRATASRLPYIAGWQTANAARVD